MPEALALTMSAAPPALPPRGSLLGFDFGLARTGVAVGELETSHAAPLTTIHTEANKARFESIQALVQEWRPVALVVGVPQALDGSDQAMSARCRRFANQLRGRFGLPVFECDERLSSAAAEDALRQSGQHDWRKRKPSLDAVAAQFILQHFLDARP